MLNPGAAGAASLAEACCDRWADGSGRLALIRPRPDGHHEEITFDALHVASCRVAQVLRARGIGRRDRVAILLPQGPEAVIALLAAWRLGAIVVPLARMLDTAALVFRLHHAGVAALVSDEAGLDEIIARRTALPALRLLLGTGALRRGALSFWEEAGRAAAGAPTEAVAGGYPAVILYAAGTDGRVRGVLHAHRALAGQLPAIAAQHGGFPQEGDRLWTPTDWAWRSGLFDALLPALCQGVPVLAAPMPHFDAACAIDLLVRHGVRNAVMPVAALRALRTAGVPGGTALRLRSIASSGVAPDAALVAWARASLGADLRHARGFAECNLMLADGDGLRSAGRAVPGHAVAVIDAAGVPLPSREAGMLAVKRPHPGMFLGYWKDPGARAPMPAGPWMPTGDRAMMAEDGAVLLATPDAAGLAGSDDGTGPDDVAQCLRRHPAVAMAAVIDAPEDLAEDHATAIIVPRSGATPGPELAEELRGFMRENLLGHRYPRRVAFAKALPRGPSGQVARVAIGSAVGLGARRTD